MALELLFGRASSDHELALLERVQATLAADDQAEIFYVVPNHIKFETEIQVLNRLATLQDRHGAAVAVPNVQVFSLSRLAWYYMQNDPIYRQANLSATGMTMLVQSLLREHQTELELYGNLLTKQGFISQFASQILELKQAGLSWQEVRDMADALTQQGTLQMKLHDLALIGEALDQELATRNQYLSSQLLAALRVYLATEKTDVSHHYYFINGYSQMTTPERGVVEALIERAGGVTIALPADDGSASVTAESLSENDLFYRPKRLAQQLRQFATDHQVAVTASSVTVQRPVSETITTVESFWIAYEQEGVKPNGQTPTPKDLAIWQATTRYQEIEQMARMIRQEVASGKRRYRDFMLMTRDLGQYENMLPAVFARYQIPVFMDLDRPMAAHPLVAFLDKLFRLAPAYTIADVMGLLKTELLIPEDVTVAEYREALAETENYVLAKNMPGWRWTDKQPWQFDRNVADSDDEVLREHVAEKDAQLALIHDQISTVVAPFLADLAQAPDAREMARRLYLFLTEIGMQQRLLAWRDEAIAQGDLWTAQQPEQVWRTFIGVLDDFVAVFDHTPMTIAELQELLKAAFDSAKYTGIPATMDQVRVSESGIVQRQGYHTVIVFGATSVNLPATTRTKALLHDGDREILQDRLPEHAFLRETSEQQMAQESLLMYSAMMTAADRLIWLYATSDGEGSQQPSTYVTRLMKQFNVPIRHFAALPDPNTMRIGDYVGTVDSTLAHLVSVNRQAANQQPAGTLSSAWQTLQQQVSQMAPDKTARVMGGLTYRNEPQQILASLMSQLFSNDLKVSISRLENYAKNPFEFFLQYGLRLKERQVLQLTPAEKGTLMHTILEQLFAELIRQDKTLSELTDSELENLERNILNGLLRSGDATFDIFSSSARMTFLTQRLAAQVHDTVLNMKRGQLVDGGVHTLGVEAGFGLPQSKLKPVQYELPLGKVTVRGKVDRYDLVETPTGNFLTIVDYKSGKRTFDYTQAFAGLELQLMTYWTAMLANATVLPPSEMGGAVFWSLQNPWIKVKDIAGDTLAELQTQADVAAANQGTYRGVLRNDEAYIERLEGVDGVKAPFAIKRNKNGSFAKAADVVDEADLDILLAFNEAKIRQIASQILAGQFPLLPFRDGPNKTGMMYTPFKPVMMFDAMMGNQYRNIKKLDAKDALAAMQSVITDEEDD
ncbi:ATP-dependent deoxyribonuclease subunit B [Weissella cibaria]|uniref:PD-(D/E)XK nuclease family protein n=1 Tax=Weissella cibaria TaxID=137591 RepID=UPI001196C91F|nr:PD-(D/E)XK nuclease family protein [Weissella cibaria]TVV33297.1 ATP-dependent deoxyribonuclease subunit B [Weissella cibaria]